MVPAAGGLRMSSNTTAHVEACGHLSTQQQASTRRLPATPTARSSLQTGQAGGTVPYQHYSRGLVSVLSPGKCPSRLCSHPFIWDKKEYKLENFWRKSLDIRKAKLSLMVSGQQEISL